MGPYQYINWDRDWKSREIGRCCATHVDELMEGALLSMIGKRGDEPF
jgi:hypothetical protein